MPFVIQSTLLLLAPILFATSLYMTLKRVVVAVQGQKHSPITPRWLTRIFVFGDVFSFIVQSSGAGLRIQADSGDSDTDPNLGSNIIVGGLIFQILIFAVFIVTTLLFNRRIRRDPATVDRAIDVPWQQTLNMLYATSAFVMVRNIFCVAEYVMGSDGYLLSVEWGVYVFDATLMALTMGWFLWRYPHKVKQALSNRNRIISMDDDRQIKGMNESAITEYTSQGLCSAPSSGRPCQLCVHLGMEAIVSLDQMVDIIVSECAIVIETISEQCLHRSHAV